MKGQLLRPTVAPNETTHRDLSTACRELIAELARQAQERRAVVRPEPGREQEAHGR